MKQAVLLGIGCNVQPAIQIPKILNALVTRFEAVWLSSLVMTKPVGVENAADFCNGVLYFYSDLSEEALNVWCKQLELKIGRTPQDCKSKQIADLDLLWCGDSQQVLNPSEIIKESYYLQPAQEVLALVGQLAPEGDIKTTANYIIEVLQVLGPNGGNVGNKATVL
ncbi:2-amino-4-hydroxy-6-hydroxymethyldihydropteridine diphosphokinase [Spartinivicinus ruber]|uniref:2-amino-4-hydroxy-6- hydroxymethyldihydropteridine diphosphokinase n=1 Tax=Spartinivicinus ruber TaxID=2683272 RepID=UPI0013D859EB|nr:2-amino-4-hydroxy-6-hydroxymethyldihydropteridine diphosphokinase [Spartinivicinus ruber]